MQQWQRNMCPFRWNSVSYHLSVYTGKTDFLKKEYLAYIEDMIKFVVHCRLIMINKNVNIDKIPIS
jgi:hypothetical protein